MWLTMILAIVFVFFTMLGLWVAISPILKRMRVKSDWTEVDATCVRVESVSRRSTNESASPTYRPVWEFMYYEIPMTSSEKSSASYLNIPIGTQMKIYVNPQNPEEILAPFKRDLAFTTVFGLLWAVVGVFLMIVIVTNKIG